MLLAAFAISLVVHAAIAILVHPWTQEREHERFVTMRRITIARVMPPPERPLVRKVLTPRQTSRIAPPRLQTTAVKGAESSVLQGRPSPPATARPATPAPSACVTADAPAVLVSSTSPPDISPQMRALDVSGVAAVRVDLDRNGTVTAASIAQSTGDPSFDALAISMARDAQYAPAHHACAAVASSYVFRVQFFAW